MAHRDASHPVLHLLSAYKQNLDHSKKGSCDYQNSYNGQIIGRFHRDKWFTVLVEASTKTSKPLS